MTGALTLPFGKHKGTAITDVPLGYLRFLLTLENLRADTRKAIEAEVARRQAAPSTEAPRAIVDLDAEMLIQAGVEALTKRFPGAEPAIAMVAAELRAGLVAF